MKGASSVIAIILVLIGIIALSKFAMQRENIYSEMTTVQGHSCPAGTREYGCEFGTTLVCTCQRFIPCVADADCKSLPVQCSRGLVPLLTCQNNGQQTYCDAECVFYTPIMPPSPPSIIEIFKNVWNSIVAWIKSLLGMSIISANQIAKTGDTFSYTFNLPQSDILTLPDTDYSDGSRSWLYKGVALFDSSSKIVTQETSEITTPTKQGDTVTVTINYAIKSTDVSGDWSASGILIKVEKTWDSNTQTWIQKEPVTLSKQAVKFTVQTITEPTTPSFSFTDIFNAIINWIKALFGWK